MRHLFFYILFFPFLGLLICINTTLYAQDSGLEKLQNKLKLQDNDSLKTKTLIDICLYLAKTNPSLAIHYAKEGISLTKKTNDLHSESEFYRAMGITYTGISKYDSAHFYLEKGLKIAEETNYKSNLARLYNSLGNLYDYEAKQKESLEAYLKSLNLREELRDTSGTILMLNNIGLFHSDNGNYNKSLEYLNKAKLMAEKKGDKANISISFSNLSDVYQNLNQFEKAKEYELKSLIFMRELKDIYRIRVSLNSLGLICNDLKEYNAAKIYFEECLGMAKKAEDKDLIVSCYYGLAKVQEGLKNWQGELKYAKLAEEKSQEINSQEGLAWAYEALYKGNEALGNYKEALAYHILLKQINDSLFSAEKSAKVMEMQTKYEVEKKETENALLKKEKDLKDARIRQQMWVIVSTLIIMGLVVFLSMMLYRSRQKEKGINVILESQKTELQHKNRLLEELNTIKDRLFSIISHDLRAPLNSLKSLLGLLNDNTMSQEQVTALFPRLTQDVGYTSDLLDSLLQWAKSQLHGIHVSPKKLNIYNLVAENLSLLHTIAEQKKIIFRNEIGENAIVWADEDMIRTILRNLISNALKFTKANGEILISAQNREKEVVITVADTGIGMSQAVLSQLFTGNITARGTKNEKGTGLGLILVKDFVEKNNGTIQIKSEVGKGSEFIFTLPLAEV